MNSGNKIAALNIDGNERSIEEKNSRKVIPQKRSFREKMFFSSVLSATEQWVDVICSQETEKVVKNHQQYSLNPPFGSQENAYTASGKFTGFILFAFRPFSGKPNGGPRMGKRSRRERTLRRRGGEKSGQNGDFPSLRLPLLGERLVHR